MAEESVIFVKMTAKEDGLPLWVNIGVVLGLRELEGGGVCLLTNNGALHVNETLDLIFSLPSVQCWQVPEKPPGLSGAGTVGDMIARVEDEGLMPVGDPPKTE
jgi:hypothetical protein